MKATKFFIKWYLLYMVGMTLLWLPMMFMMSWSDMVTAPAAMIVGGMVSLFVCIVDATEDM